MNRTYFIKRREIDPFDIMCGECQEHEIEWLEEITEKELRDMHSEEFSFNQFCRDFYKDFEIEWEVVPEKFEEWLAQAVNSERVMVEVKGVAV